MPRPSEREDRAPDRVDEPKLARPGDRTAELEARCDELQDRLLRVQADYQNSRRRAQAELENALLRTLQPLLDELLLVLDYLDMALSAPLESPDARSLAAGVELTRSKLQAALELTDVRPIPTSGRFDPAWHEALESRPSPLVEPGTILATVRPGYTWQGRVLRPARVIVAGGPVSDASPDDELPMD
jgi:molecular chaperone GrpE